MAQEVAQLTLLGGGEALEAWRGLPDAVEHLPAQLSSGLCQDDMLDAPVMRAWLTRDESPGLEPVDEPSDVGVVAGQKCGKFVHRERRAELQQRPRLGGVQVKF